MSVRLYLEGLLCNFPLISSPESIIHDTRFQASRCDLITRITFLNFDRNSCALKDGIFGKQSRRGLCESDERREECVDAL